MKTSAKYLLVSLAVILFCQNVILAQSKQCDVIIKVFDSDSNTVVNNFKPQIINLDKEKLYKPKDANIPGLFENVNSGNISIAIDSEGYARKFHKTMLECESEEKDFTKTIDVSVSKNTKQGYFVISASDGKSNAVNEYAVKLGKPFYPPAARATRVSGIVQVEAVIDLEGKVIYANALTAHPLLKSSSEEAAVKSRFKPTTIKGTPVLVAGIIVYNFVP